MPNLTTPQTRTRPWPKPVRAAATRLGITRHDTMSPPPAVHSAANAPELQFLPPPGHILVLTGPSGCGKTTALRHLAALARRQRRPIFFSDTSPAPPHPGPAAPARLARLRPDWSTDQSLAHLARFGLAEAHCLTTPAHQLSTGQQHRLHLAELVAAALRAKSQISRWPDHQTKPTRRRTCASPSSGPPPICSSGPLLLLDEFAASLDDLTATTLARTLARAARDCNLTIILATHRLCVLQQLQPCTVVELTSTGIRHRAPGTSGEKAIRDQASGSRTHSTAASSPAPSPSGGGQGRGSTPSLFPTSSHSSSPHSASSSSSSPLHPLSLRERAGERVYPNSTSTSSHSSSSSPLASWRIEPAHPRDYHTLAHLHYRPGHPATIAGIWRAVMEPTIESHPSQPPQLAGVLVVSHPTLNAAWREHAWPARYTRGDKRQRAKRLNAELRCIARVIIDPRFRSLGLATQLVRHYLNNPLTPHTEALAAMGALSPFFERAGMTPYPLPPSPRDARLLDLLTHAHLDPTWLAEPDHAWQRLINAIGEPLAQRELRSWAQQVPTIRKQCETTWFTHACRTLMSTPVAYAHASSEQTTPARTTSSKEPPTQVGGFFERPNTIVRPPTPNPPTRVGGSLKK